MTARTPSYRKRGGGVAGDDAAMRDGAAQDRRVQHALALQIADELAAAAQKAQILDPLDRAADIGLSRSCLVGLPVGGARFEHRLDDRDIAGAAAQIARQCRADAIGVGIGLLG